MIPLRVRAPGEDGGVLAVPPPALLPGHLAGNRHLLDGWDYSFQGRSAGQLRSMIRKQAAAACRVFHERLGLGPPPPCCDGKPLIVTGHQPELFHPGVWAKNFAAHVLAKRFGGHALNLIVDNDIPHRTAIRVPYQEPGGLLRTTPVAFDRGAGELPFEDYRVGAPDVFRSFPEEVRKVLGSTVPDPVLDRFWPEVERSEGRTDRVGERFTAARHALEVEAGCGMAEMPLSALCETEGFLWFAAHLIAHVDRFHEVHNHALAAYRALYGIRSHRHPVPALAVRSGWAEAPFWVWREGSTRRRTLLVQARPDRTIALRIPDEPEPFLELPLDADREACCAVDRLRELPAAGIRLRTRALTTTMFARLLLGDLFIHGIGGAKYDELGDEIVRRFFQVVPPTFLTLSMTIRLALPEVDGAAAAVEALTHRLRDMQFNPDRYLEAHDDGVAAWLTARQEAIAGPVGTRRERVDRFRRIREANAALQPFLAARRQAALHELTTLEAASRSSRVARDREFSLVLHSARRLHQAFQVTLPQALDV